MVGAARDRARELLRAVAGRALSSSELEAASLELAGHLFALSEQLVDAKERARRKRLSRLLDDPAGQLFSILLTDRVARDHTFEHAAGQLRHLIEDLGVPRFMSPAERAQLALGCRVGKVAPRVVGTLVARHIRTEVEGLVFPIETGALQALLAERRAEGVRVNLNQLGEEVLAEAQALQRLDQYLALLARPEIEALSVKLSSIFSQFDIFAWEASRERVAERLRHVYRAALGQSRSGASRPKLVYLDMEAYRDLRFTVELVQRVLAEPEFLPLSAGLVLQAYIPESAALQRELNEWARLRAERGGARLRLRIVKGANLAAERVLSARMSWPLPIYGSKHEVDANYKRMLDVATQPEHASHIELGIASHNVFDLAYGLVLRASRGVEAYVGFEVLEGMARSLQRALVSLGAPVLSYAPAVSEHDLDTAVAYLIRRLDENTSHENFLRYAFSMRRADARYEAQARRFCEALRAKDSVGDQPLRPEDRFAVIGDLPPDAAFRNEPDSDFSMAPNREAVTRALGELARRAAFDVCPVIGGVRRETNDVEHGFDPSRPRVVPYRYHLAGRPLLEVCVSCAAQAAPAQARRSPEERCELARSVARLLRRRRAELIAAIVMDAGKRVVEADAEVSEAIDLAEYYSRSLEAQARDPAIVARPKGVVFVASPWNFPLAIPTSGVLAVLLAGNAVIFKPACETPFVAFELARVLWDAGVPQEVLQFVLCRDEDGSFLLTHPAVNAVVLTGATSTARFFLEQRPGLDLHAETGGKNPFIIASLVDRELAVRDLIHSAFSYAGQKCSAASLAILAPQIYHDPSFRRLLRDATESLVVGSAWQPESTVTPLIRPPGEALLRGLTQLEPGESWLLEPRPHPDNPRLWSPGIKWGVSAGSFTQQTELFGPVLGVLCARDLEHALELANGTAYGLTAGLHGLDEREQQRFVRGMAAGNLYVNRTITGAIVGRQPFGGQKASSVGPGAKAGGPNYVFQLQELSDADISPAAGELSAADRGVLDVAAPVFAWFGREGRLDDLSLLERRAQSYASWGVRYFRPGESGGDVLGQDNRLLYRPCGPLLLVVHADTPIVDVASVVVAARLARAPLELVVLGGAGSEASAASALAMACSVSLRCESAPELAARIASARPERIRWLAGPPPEAVLRAAAGAGCYVSTRPVLGHGRYELLFYYREQAVSVEYHRYGHLGRSRSIC